MPDAPVPAAIVRTAAIHGARRSLALHTAGVALAAALIVGGVVGDAALALPGWMRAGLLPAAVLLAVGSFAASLALLRRLRPGPRDAARLLEQATGDTLRRATAALELAAMPGELAAAGASRQAPAMATVETAVRAMPAPSRPWMILGMLALATAAVATLVPGLWSAVWPRLADPHGDHPPWSLSHLAWDAAPAAVRIGEPARFAVRVSGRAAAGLVLVASDGGGHLRSAPMVLAGPGRYTGTLAGVEHPLRVWAEGAGTRTTYHDLRVDPMPELSELAITLAQPGWAGIAAENRRLGPGGRSELAALPGASIDLRPSANRPLTALWIDRGAGPERCPLRDGAVRLEPAAGTWSLALEAADGIRSDACATLAISILPDHPPRALIAEPARDALCTASARLHLVFAAEDDYVLERTVRRGGIGGLPGPELRAAATGKVWRHEQDIDLATVGARPGDVLSFTIEARDGGPARQWSDPGERTVKVISDAEYNRLLAMRLPPEALAEKYQPMLDELKAVEQAIADALAEDRATAKDLDQRLAKLAQRASELSARAEAMHRAEPLWALEPALQAEIARAARAAAAAATAGKPQPGEAAALAHDIQRMIRGARAMALIARLRQIAQAEQNASDRLLPYARHRRPTDAERVELRGLGDDEAALADALDEWVRLADEVAALLLDSADGGSPDDAAARTAGELAGLEKDLAEAGVADLKRRAAAAARGGDGAEAHRLASEARDKLLALMRRNEACESACRGIGLGLGWCNSADGIASLLGLGIGAGSGWGLGGSGMAGLGIALGYGGSDLGATLPSMANDLIGPEMFGAGAAGRSNRPDRVAGMAAGGTAAAPAAGSTPERRLRRSTATGGAAMDPALRKVVDDYFRRLEEKP